MNILSELRRTPGFMSRYEIGEVLGRGGMGEVYLAYDTFRECDVAIKVAPNAAEGSTVDERIRKLWLQETRLAGKLKHPYVVAMYEAVTVEHLSYIVMEYVNGGTLKKHATSDTLLPIERVVDLTFKVARALEYANTMGLLHRDIKPANILLTGDGSPKVSDFGSAYMTGVEATQVFDVGTLPYMPPETFSGAKPTLQSDIYGVGVMAYELLTGAWPFTAQSQAAMIYQKSHGETAPLEARRPDVPGELRAVVNRAMHRDPALRYPGWSSLCDDLARLMPGIHVEAEVVMQSAQFELFKATAFFSEFTETELWEAVRICQARRVAAGASVFDEGSSGCSMYVLTIGELDVVSRGVTPGKIRAGECFGELAFVQAQNHTRSATIVARAPSSFVEFGGESMTFASPSLQAALARAIMRTLVERIRSTDDRFVAATLGQQTTI